MKIIRSTKCSLKFSTEKKIEDLKTILSEYGRVVNIFINYFWNNPNEMSKTKLLKPIVSGNLKKRLTTKNIQENEAISNCKIE